MLTVRLRRAFEHSQAVSLVCGRGNTAASSRVRVVAVGGERRVVSADIGPPRGGDA